jgi:hypothetical protein
MKHTSFLYLFLFSIGWSISSYGQSEQVNLKKEAGIDNLINKHIEYNKAVGTISGYRLQIFSGSGNFSKSNAISQRSAFMGRYPSVKAYIIFNTPYYIVRAGNFRTRLDAEAFRQRIIEQYPEVYVVRDDIDLPDWE